MSVKLPRIAIGALNLFKPYSVFNEIRLKSV